MLPLISGRSSHVPHNATAGVQHSEDQRRSNQAETRHEEYRKEDRCEQRADVVKREHARDELFEFDLVFEDAQQQRDFETDKHADREHHEIEHERRNN